MAWPHIFANLTQSFLSYLDDNFNAAALLGGSSTQTFEVADATAANQAVSMAQTVDFSNNNITASAKISPVAFRTIITCANSAAITLTLEGGSVIGQQVSVQGSGGASVTIQSSVSSGSPNFQMPWNASIYSFILFQSNSSRADFIWDGENWRVNIGPIRLAPVGATAANALGQTSVTVDTPTFTAPCPGILQCIATAFSSGEDIISISISTSLPTTNIYANPAWNGGRALSFVPVLTGQSTIITGTATVGSGGSVQLFVDGLFQPG